MQFIKSSCENSSSPNSCQFGPRPLDLPRATFNNVNSHATPLIPNTIPLITPPPVSTKAASTKTIKYNTLNAEAKARDNQDIVATNDQPFNCTPLTDPSPIAKPVLYFYYSDWFVYKSNVDTSQPARRKMALSDPTKIGLQSTTCCLATVPDNCVDTYALDVLDAVSQPTAYTNVFSWAFFKIQQNGTIALLDSWADNRSEMLGFTEINSYTGSCQPAAFNAATIPLIKAQQTSLNRTVEFMLALGGWCVDPKTYYLPAVMNDPTLRATFVASIVATLNTYGFDGVEIDWEYPYPDGLSVKNDTAGFPNFDTNPQVVTSSDASSYIQFIQEFKAAAPNKKITVTLAGADNRNSGVVNSRANPQGTYALFTDAQWSIVEPLVTYFNLMTYDFQLPGTYGQLTSHNSCVNPCNNPPPGVKLSSWSMRTAVKYFANNVYPLTNNTIANKIILGLPMYARTWKLVSAPATPSQALYAPSSGPGSTDNVVDEKGQIAVVTALQRIANQPTTISTFIDQDALGSFYYDSLRNEFVSYPDCRFLQGAIDLVKEFSLGGLMSWEITLEDSQQWTFSKYLYTNLA